MVAAVTAATLTAAGFRATVTGAPRYLYQADPRVFATAADAWYYLESVNRCQQRSISTQCLCSQCAADDPDVSPFDLPAGLAVATAVRVATPGECRRSPFDLGVEYRVEPV